MSDPLSRSRFERWKSRAPTKTRELAELVEKRLIPRLVEAGFERVSVFEGDPENPVRGDEIQMERRVGDAADAVHVFFAKYALPRFQVGCSRRLLTPSAGVVRSCHLVRNGRQYLHFWGKPWWRPNWLWSTQDAARTVDYVAGRTDQMLAFVEGGVVGPNVSRQDIAALRRN